MVCKVTAVREAEMSNLEDNSRVRLRHRKRYLRPAVVAKIYFCRKRMSEHDLWNRMGESRDETFHATEAPRFLIEGVLI